MAEQATVRAHGSRQRVLQAARELFVEHGYRRTSLQRIADRLGLSKAAILYHFPTKADILAALAEPLLNDLEAALDRAEQVEGAAARWVAIEGHLDALLAHRGLLRMLSHDFALLGQEGAGRRFYRIAQRANALVAGPDPTPEDRVRAAQAIAMLSDPIVPFADAPTEWLRAQILDGVRRLLGDDLADARHARRGRRAGPGRPPAMDEAMTAEARRLRDAGVPVADIARALGVSRATVYRHLSSGNGEERHEIATSYET